MSEQKKPVSSVCFKVGNVYSLRSMSSDFVALLDMTVLRKNALNRVILPLVSGLR